MRRRFIIPVIVAGVLPLSAAAEGVDVARFFLVLAMVLAAAKLCGEAAERIGCTLPALKARLERGRRLLRTALERRGVESYGPTRSK